MTEEKNNPQTDFNEVAAPASHEPRHCLHIAVKSGDKDRVKAMIEGGTHIETQDEKGWTALHHAVWHGDFQMVEFVLNMGAYPNPITEDGKYPACLAKERGHKSIEDFMHKMTEQKQPTELLAEWLDNPKIFTTPKKRSRKKPAP